MGKLIFEVRDLEEASAEIQNSVDRALLAAAFKIRDEMRSCFRKDAATTYEHKGDVERMADGIMVGKLTNSKVKVHALGSRVDDGTYKTRFFVGGTIYRKGTSSNGKVFSKGYIQALDSVEKGIANADTILNEFINNALNN